MDNYHVEAELLAYLDGALSASEHARVEAHLATCPHCTREMERLQALRAELDSTFDAALSPVRLSKDAEARIRANLRVRVERPRWWWVLRFHWGFFVQAALAILVVLFSLNAYQMLQTPVFPVQETLVLGQRHFSPGSRAALRVVVRDSVDATPVSDAEVSVSIGKAPGLARLVYTGRTDAAGTAQVAFMVPGDLEGETDLIVDTRSGMGEGQVVHPITIARSYKLFLTSDKPVYRPGQLLYLRVLALDALDLTPVSEASVSFEVLDADGELILSRVARTSNFGVASAEITLPDSLAEGTLMLRAALGDTLSERSVMVGSYVLPPFQVVVDLDRSFSLAGEQVAGVVHAAYFFEKPVAEADVRLRGYVRDPEVVEAVEIMGLTDEDGNFVFAVDLPDGYGLDAPAFFDLDVAVRDSAGQWAGTTKSLPVSSQPILIQVVPESGVLKPGVENTLFILTSYPDGTPAATEVQLSVDGTTEVLQTDSYGLVAYRFVPAGTSAQLLLNAQDEFGRVGVEQLALTVASAPQVLLLRAERATYEIGDTLRLEVLTSGISDGHPIYLDIVRNGQMAAALSEPLSGGRAIFALDLDASLMGSLQLHSYTLSPENTLVGDSRWVVVDAPQRVNVSITADQEIYRPGETAHFDFQTRLSETGQPVVAALGMSVVDTSVYALETLPVDFARLYFLLDQELFARRATISNFQQLLEEPGALARDLSAKAAWADIPAAELTLSAQAESQAIEDPLQEGLLNLLGAILILLPLLLTVVVVRRLRVFGTLQLALRRTGLGILGFILASPVMGAIIGGGIWLLWKVTGVVGMSLIVIPVLGLLGILAAQGWRRHDAKLQVVTGITGAYLIAGLWLVLLLARQGALSSLVLFLIGLTFLLMVASLALLGQGIILEGRHRTGWMATFLGLSLVPLVIYLSLIPTLRSDLTQTLRSMAFYGSPVSWMTGCAALPSATEEEPAAEGEVTEEPTEAPAEESMAEITALPTQQPLPTATIPVMPPEPSPLRQIFPETLYWNPEMVTDEEGQLLLALPLADTITTWRVTALASTLDGDLGAASYELSVFQDFFVDVMVPETILQGEPVTATITVYNYTTDPQPVRFDLLPSDGIVLVEAPEALTVEPNDVGTVNFGILGEKAGEFALQVIAKGSDLEDGLHKIIVVEERR